MKTGREIGEYRIVRLLGKGGMSEVYEAEHLRLGSRHAVKFFTYGKNVDGVKERFLTEGKLLARLSHPRIVRVTDTGTDSETGQPYFVMDLVSGPDGNVKSLADVSAGSVDEMQVAMWYDDLRDGLSYIHGRHIVHRDLKLENVLIGPDGHAVLTDFGISKITAPEEGGEAVVDPVQTVVRLRDGKNPVMGSLGYMAPELEMGVAATPQSDYYALGVIVYRLLTGTWCDARTDVVGGLDTYDPTWRQIVPKLLHSNPRGRECLSWRELKLEQVEHKFFDLESALEKSRGKTRKEKRRARVAFVVILLSVIAAAVCGGMLLRATYLNVPSFEDVVYVPDDAPDEETDTRSSRAELENAIPDAWVLLHELFQDLRHGDMSGREVIAAMEAKAVKVKREDDHLFPDSYDSNADSEALYELLQAAIARMKERYGVE